VSGAHTGYLRANGPFFAEPPAADVDVDVESSLDGHAFGGYPTFGACSSALPTVTPLAVSTTVLASSSNRATLQVSVTANIRGDSRPVRDATVSAAGVVGKTDVTGCCSVVVPKGVSLVVTAAAGTTFASGTLVPLLCDRNHSSAFRQRRCASDCSSSLEDHGTGGAPSPTSSEFRDAPARASDGITERQTSYVRGWRCPLR